jgi:WhiB family redox-sensing transcriptional regulator
MTRNAGIIPALAVPADAPPPVDWRHLAVCKGADLNLFFPIGSDGGPDGPRVEEAKRMCARCPVQQPCLEWALATGVEYGIFGGQTENERRRWRRPVNRGDHEFRFTPAT